MLSLARPGLCTTPATADLIAASADCVLSAPGKPAKVTNKLAAPRMTASVRPVPRSVIGTGDGGAGDGGAGDAGDGLGVHLGEDGWSNLSGDGEVAAVCSA